MTSPALLLFDADGTLRWTTVEGQGYPRAPHEWRLMPNVRETLARFDWRPGGTRLGVASNQNGVAAGHLSEQMARRLLHDTVRAAIGFVPEDAAIEMCACPLSARCRCRKPEPGLLVRILHRAGVSADQALFVGDLDIDREAARRAGVPFAWAWDFFGWPKRR
jgi:D-glycero-D-manno-heptose 1,7-bisphosphate phosphatase